MKNISLLVVFLLTCFANGLAAENWSEKPIIDDQFKQVELELKKLTADCMKKEKSVIKKTKCGKALRSQYEKQGKLRGTDEYCKKHYGQLSFDELRSVWKKLKQKRRKARIRSPGDEIIPGEVTESMYMVEEFWVESRLAQKQKAGIKKKEDQVFNESQKGRGE